MHGVENTSIDGKDYFVISNGRLCPLVPRYIGTRLFVYFLLKVIHALDVLIISVLLLSFEPLSLFLLCNFDSGHLPGLGSLTCSVAV